LALAGHRTAVAHDGPSALVEARRFGPDVALLDIGLPVMDGYELAVKLRSTFGAATPRLLALTGYGQSHDRERTRDAGFIAHLVKPVDADRLLRIIAE
jgi:CheY-like chemotaxis protein